MPADDLLRRLAARPVLLWALAVLGNAVWMPHAGVTHDATLYAAQALNAHDGRFAGDLFFAYGSQSQYTALPHLLALMYAALGIDGAFFLGYLASAGLFVAGLVALLRRLLGATALLPLAVLGCACCPIPCGNAAPFSVNETFLTGRLLAGALGLFALERVAAGRWLGFAALTAAALAVHPLVAAPVGLIGVACAVARSGRWGWPVVTAATVIGLSLLAVPGLPPTIFGSMSAAWRGQIVAVMGFIDPTTWGGADLLRLGLAAAVSLGFARLGRGSPGATLAAAAVLVAGVGLLLAAYAVRSEARLLVQGQPFRWVWPLEVLRWPLALAVIARLWPGAGHLGRAGLVALSLVAAGLVLLMESAVLDGLRDAGRELAGNLLLRGTSLVALAYLGRDVLAARGAVPGLLAAALLWQGVFGEPNRGAWARAEVYQGAEEHAFVADYLRTRPDGPTPSLYLAGVDPRWVWCDLGCVGYFLPGHHAGITFSEAGAAEWFRRGRLVVPFELALADEPGRWAPLLTGTNSHAVPTQADFDALAAEPAVEVLVLRQEFPGFAATNGRVFVYDLRRSRRR